MDVVLYVLDSLRPDFLTPYDPSMDTSPNIDDLAEDSAVFTNAFAQSSWTRPSGASILSSTYPRTHGVETTKDRYPSDLPSLAEALSDAGYTCVGISAMGNISSTTGFDKGFDEFHELYREVDTDDDHVVTATDEVNWEDHFGEGDVTIATGQDIERTAAAVLDRYPDEDLFLFIWSIDTHDPYFHRDPSLREFSDHDGAPLWYEDVRSMNSEEGRETLRNLYKDMIRYADREVGRLVDTLEAAGRYDDCTFVLCGDHGEAFGEHGVNGHAGKPFDEQIQVPLLIKSDKIPSEDRQDLAELIDLYPTIVDDIGDLQQSQFAQGESLATETDKEYIYSEIQIDEALIRSACIRTQEYKYMTSERPYLSNSTSLKDLLLRARSTLRYLTDDSSGIYELKGNEIAIDGSKTEFETLSHQLAEIRDRCEKLNVEIEAEVTGEFEDTDVEDQLRAMGYIN